MTPPRVAEAMLRSVLAQRDRESIPADLAEAFAEQVALHGRRAATRWYLGQIVSIAWHVAPRSPKKNSVTIGIVLGLLMAIGVVVTNVLFPLAHVDLRESDVTEVLPWAIVLLVIALAGWWRRGDGIVSAVRAGSTVAFLAFGIVILTFLVVDNVFLDLVSQQHEKQQLLRASTYHSMRALLTIAQLRALLTVLPAVSVLGGVAGGLAGLVGKLRAR
jgi:hypothetical protein